MTFLRESPALRDFATKMWLRHEDACADAIAGELGLSEPTAEIRVYARFVLQILQHSSPRARTSEPNWRQGSPSSRVAGRRSRVD